MLERTDAGVGLSTGARDGALPGFDHERAVAAVRELLVAIGEDPDREGLRDTPRRVAQAFREWTAGLRTDPAYPLRTQFKVDYRDLLVVRDIELYSLCEHHLLPFFGFAHIAYQPAGHRVTGLSKLARVVDILARRPQIQERLTDQVAGTIMAALAAEGVLVVLECTHSCMSMRGVRKREATTVTISGHGTLAEPAGQRDALLLLTRDKRVSESFTERGSWTPSSSI